eukprot:TRINITY_DN11743_c0_g1_i1.p1 TRINITY_DN11743_c0_g1~~TRINITY_DN11743_c0_g1_i1.p1  ORF type:complete len:545 (-),score=185.91 TRINITY_DN11743_c0_g1_i1:105-1739(-)
MFIGCSVLKSIPNSLWKSGPVGTLFVRRTSLRMPSAIESPAKKLKLSEDDEGLKSLLVAERLECGENVLDFKKSKLGTNFKSRVRVLCGDDGTMMRESKGVMYWMWRDKRVQDNWALLYAQRIALELNVPLHVAVCVPPQLGEMTIRHYTFMLEGLKEVATECSELNIGFHLLAGHPPDLLTPSFLSSHDIGLVVADFSPLREHLAWLDKVTKSLEPKSISLHQVDAHNIVPIWVTSEKQEYAARTIRPKVTKNLPEFLTQFPPVIEHPVDIKGKVGKADFEAVYNTLEVDTKGWGVEPVDNFPPGTNAGLKNLKEFVDKRIKAYGGQRNDPNVAALSNMSPWVNMGQVSMQRAVLYVKKHGKSYSDSVASFVEEAVVRRELSDNFCYYNKNYDSVKGATDWAQKTLNDHKQDKREYLYTRQQLEEGKTHDDLWNAAQLQLVKEGKLHGFLRMYWAKKVLEWTESPEVALKEALRLNDRYALDGNDPNGFVGVMWSICGIHDQGWAERAVFGKIRFMNYAGCKRKFDINKFIIKYGGKVYSSKK